MYRHKYITSLLLFLGLLLGSCVKDNLFDCLPRTETGLRLDFRYILNTEHRCLFVDKVKTLHVYIFDQRTGKLARAVHLNSTDITRQSINVALPEGAYTISAWGSNSDRMLQEGGYAEAEMIDRTRSIYASSVTVGSTTLDNFCMMLATQPLHSTMPYDTRNADEVSPVSGTAFDDLYSIFAKDATVLDGQLQVVDLSMIQNTSTLHIKIAGINHLPAIYDAGTRATDIVQPAVCIAGRNERYNYDNTIDPYSRTVFYEPLQTSVSDTEMSLDIRVQRLDIEHFDRQHQPIVLHVRHPDTGRDIMEPIDIINDVILKAEDKQGNRVWPNQQEIDRTNQFSIEVAIRDDLSICVLVNGFEAIHADATIDRS